MSKRDQTNRPTAGAHAIWPALIGLLVAAGLAGCAGSQSPAPAPGAGGSTSEAFEARKLVELARLTVEGFDVGQNNAAFLEQAKKARGVLIFPAAFRAAFIVGGQGGNGVLLTRDAAGTRWNGPAFYTLGGASVGFQAGAKVSEVVALLMTDRGVTGLLNPTVALGADVSVAAGPVGGALGAGTAGLSADVLSYARSTGLFGGVALDGAVISTRNDRNAAYYGRSVTASDILVRGEAHNPQAAPLVAAVAKLTGTAGN